MEGFYTWVKSIVAFLLLASLIYQILPDSEYKKYLKVCTGMLLVLAAVWPVLGWSGSADRLSYFLGLENLKIDMSGFEQAGQEAEAKKQGMVTDMYKLQLEKQVFAVFEDGPFYPVHTEISMVEDAQSEQFGKILSVEVSVTESPEHIEEAVAQENDAAMAQNNSAAMTQNNNAAMAQNSDTAVAQEDGAAAVHNSEALDRIRRRIADALYISDDSVHIEVR